MSRVPALQLLCDRRRLAIIMALRQERSPSRSMQHHEAASLWCQVAAMRGGEDVDGRRRRPSSRGSLSGSLTNAPAAPRASRGSVTGPSAVRAGTADRRATAATSAVEVLSTGSTERNCADSQPAPLVATTGARPQPLAEAEHHPSSCAERDASSSQRADDACGAGRADVAWQPGIELMETLEPGSPTEARRLSESAVAGPRSYPLSPGGLAAVSPELLPRTRPDITSGGGQAEQGAAAAVPGDLPAPEHPAADPVYLTGLPRIAQKVQAAPVAGQLAGQGSPGASLSAVSSISRPLEKQSSNVATADAMSAAAKQGVRHTF